MYERPSPALKKGTPLMKIPFLPGPTLVLVPVLGVGFNGIL